MRRKNPKVSAIIIAKNEEPRIALALASLTCADEIVVIDNGSSDKTVQVAKRMGAVVFSVSKKDFSEIRNEAARKARGTWLLYVDADEIVTRELTEEISRLVAGHPQHDAYEINRINYYLGVRFPVSEWMVRLIRRKALSGWEGKIHESARVNGSIGRLTASIVHHTHRTLSEMVAKTNEWSETEAMLRLLAHHPRVTWWRIFRVMATGFWHSFVAQGGWRVGTAGLVESMYQGFSMFITYAKLWEMQEERQKQSVKQHTE